MPANVKNSESDRCLYDKAAAPYGLISDRDRLNEHGGIYVHKPQRKPRPKRYIALVIADTKVEKLEQCYLGAYVQLGGRRLDIGKQRYGIVGLGKNKADSGSSLFSLSDRPAV